MSMCPIEETDKMRERSASEALDLAETTGMPQNESAQGDLAVVIGYRANMGGEGACDELRGFASKVEKGDVWVGDYDHKTCLLKRLAGGSFGEVYLGKRNDTGKRVAVKVEPQANGLSPMLLNEGNAYRSLEGGPGIPHVYWFGYHGKEFSVIIMDMLGPTIQDQLNNLGKCFTLKTVLLLLEQIINILEHVHKQGFVHRDISPSNFLFGSEEGSSTLFLIDFGHAKRYETTFRVKPRRPSVNSPRAVVGTPRFIGVHPHLSHEEAPRDDLEALGYILIYLLRGSLPWQGLRAASMPEKLNKIGEMKINTPLGDLCAGLPEEFALYIDYVRHLGPFQPADYEGIRTLFRGLADKQGIVYDGEYDWMSECAETTEAVPVPERSPERDTQTSDDSSPVSH